MSIYRVGADDALAESPAFCAGTYGWRNGAAGHWVVAARRGKSTRIGESDWPEGFLRVNSVLVPESGVKAHDLHVVAGGLAPDGKYVVAIKHDSARGFQIGDTVSSEWLARTHRLTKKPAKLKGKKAVRTAKILKPRKVQLAAGQTFDLVLLKKVGKDTYEVKALDNPETPGFTVQAAVPAERPSEDLVQKALTYKTEFGLEETISVGVNPPYAVQCRGQRADIHILASGCELKADMMLADAGCARQTVLTVPIQPGCRNVNTHPVANSTELGVGSYCTVVDIDQDGRYDRGLDVADGCVEDDPGPGFLVKKAPPEPVPPTMCEEFLLLREEVNQQVTGLRKRAKRHLKVQEEWDFCEHFTWTIEMDH
ncbi:MAG: hypothetical protein QF464_22885, partial [Myxococcota bacterium]|nr:hypothetical protein [Myxococcota bacterium]